MNKGNKKKRFEWLLLGMMTLSSVGYAASDDSLKRPVTVMTKHQDNRADDNRQTQTDALTDIQKRLAAIQTLDAQFTQEVRTKRGVVSKTKGMLAIARPGRFYWKTRQPNAQTMIADGQSVWVYDPDLEQVVIHKQAQNLGAAGALFLSQSTQSFEQTFKVSFSKQAQTETFVLKAKSSRASFEQVTLVFEKKILQEIQIDDQLGQHSCVKLKQVHMNKPQPAHLFSFKVPPGVDVIRQ